MIDGDTRLHSHGLSWVAIAAAQIIAVPTIGNGITVNSAVAEQGGLVVNLYKFEIVTHRAVAHVIPPICGTSASSLSERMASTFSLAQSGRYSSDITPTISALR